MVGQIIAGLIQLFLQCHDDWICQLKEPLLLKYDGVVGLLIILKMLCKRLSQLLCPTSKYSVHVLPVCEK